MDQPPVTAEAAQRAVAAGELLDKLEARIGRRLTREEGRALCGVANADYRLASPDEVRQATGRDSSQVMRVYEAPFDATRLAELSVVEAEVIVRLVAYLEGANVTYGVPTAQAQRELVEGLGGIWLPWIGRSVVLLLLMTAGGSLASDQIGLPLGCAVVSLVLAGVTQLERLHCLRLLQQELPRSNIIERLGENDPELDDVVASTPPPVRWVLFAGLRRNLESRVRLVIRNLDWYLRPPAVNLRWHWLYRRGPLLLVPLLLLLGAGLLLGRVSAPDIGLYVMLGLYLAPFSLAPPLDLIYADALLTKLRGRMLERIEVEAGAA